MICQILSYIAKLFDPLGWLAPVTIRAKIFMQDLWKSNLKWDELIFNELAQEWKIYYDQLDVIEDISVPRYIQYQLQGAKYELHGFCDASEKGFSACIYLRVIHSDSSYSCYLIMSKTRVAPVKIVSLPRLELCGAVLLIRLMK